MRKITLGLLAIHANLCFGFDKAECNLALKDRLQSIVDLVAVRAAPFSQLNRKKYSSALMYGANKLLINSPSVCGNGMSSSSYALHCVLHLTSRAYQTATDIVLGRSINYIDPVSNLTKFGNVGVYDAFTAMNKLNILLSAEMTWKDLPQSCN